MTDETNNQQGSQYYIAKEVRKFYAPKKAEPQTPAPKTEKATTQKGTNK